MLFELNIQTKKVLSDNDIHLANSEALIAKV